MFEGWINITAAARFEKILRSFFFFFDLSIAQTHIKQP